MAYSFLRADCVIATIENLVCRVGERFPESGLKKVAEELAATAKTCAAEADRLSKPQRSIRAGVYAVWAFGAAAAGWVATGLHYDGFDWKATSFVQVLEPAMNIAVLVGIGVLTLGRLEERYKRARALEYLHRLRSIAHVVDMHQLTKDPYKKSLMLPATAHSPKTPLSNAMLERYLDYCSELAALTGKLAALLAQSCKDGEVVAAASDVEDLTTGLSRKIWQKIMVIGRGDHDEFQAPQARGRADVIINP
ncbi:MAG: hypothetical protein AB7F91_13730 [Parvularculaceae bacterium]